MQKFFDYNESYMKWMHETGLPPFIDQHCNTNLEEVSFPKVSEMAVNGSGTGASHAYIVQREPYVGCIATIEYEYNRTTETLTS